MNTIHPNEYSIGVDEVGRGPWAGPVVACAFRVIDPAGIPREIMATCRDSKQVSPLKRAHLSEQFHILRDHEIVQFEITSIPHDVIDATNIVHATDLAMGESVLKLSAHGPLSFILVDGPRYPPTITHPGVACIKGDQNYFMISAASILAKVHRDTLMSRLHAEYPEYGWITNQGYGTKFHQKALQRYGISLYHRISIKPIKILLKTT